MPSGRARTAALGAGWIAAAVLAVGGGLLAVGEVGDGIVANQAEPLSQQEIADRLVAPTSQPVAPGTEGPRVAGAVPEVIGTPGGTVLVECAGTTAIVLSSIPAPGYSVHEGAEFEDDGRTKLEFKGRGGEVEVEISCQDGHPVVQTHIDGD